MSIDPPYRLDPFQNIINVQWQAQGQVGVWWVWMPTQSAPFYDYDPEYNPCHVRMADAGNGTLESALIQMRDYLLDLGPAPYNYPVRCATRNEGLALKASKDVHPEAVCDIPPDPPTYWYVTFAVGSVTSQWMTDNHIPWL